MSLHRCFRSQRTRLIHILNDTKNNSQPMDDTSTSSMSCSLLHHGAAANSSSKTVICIPSKRKSGYSSEIVYASHAMLNVAQQSIAQVETRQEPVWKVHETLRTQSQGSATANNTVSTYTAKRVISCISMVHNTKGSEVTLLCGFTDGTISTWRRSSDKDNDKDKWTESIMVRADDPEFWDGRSITDIGGIQETNDGYCLVTCSSGGAFQYRSLSSSSSSSSLSVPTGTLTRTQLLPIPANTVRFHNLASNDDVTLLLIGTAAPRHNKIHVFVLYDEQENPSTHYCGALAGHEDWITCFDWCSIGNVDHLASGSQDARIRLWKFTTTNTPTIATATAASFLPVNMNAPDLEEDLGIDGDEDDDDDDDEEEIEEGESRLEVVVPGKSQTSVTLEALLIGHEERVTAVSWHPNPKPIYGDDLILISSSMDRCIFIWAEVSGIWAPISRVGSAGGILGGSIGSSLLGFLNIQLEPQEGKWMMGLGYGGALHFFSCESKTADITDDMTVEDRAALSPWKAQPCITGHFEAVTDLCWESNAGEYLLTVGNDQTCRVWASLPLADGTSEQGEVWVEIARPQVHGYDLSAIASLSTPDQRHIMVTGADEKELRVFDATRTFDKLLRRVSSHIDSEDTNARVDLAYIPSLGLSNKATASEGAEQDTGGVSESSTQLPLERDLGAVSLWPEVRKLYGHNTELTRLTATTTAKSGVRSETDMLQRDVLVASSAKARDVEAACIRIWNVIENRCAQVLQGGHRSTVTALAFSPDTRFLVSSGKDRRLCVWERKLLEENKCGTFELSSAVDSAHKRIVWGAHCCPFDSTVFATCSRDGTIKLWKVLQNETTTVIKETLMFSPTTLASNGKPESVTSISFAPKAIKEDVGTAVLAVGLENGLIELWLVPVDGSSKNPKLLYALPSNYCHIASVTKLAWRPIRPTDATDGAMVLASASMDHGCRIFKLQF